MSLRRHVLQVVALVTAVALVFGAFAGSASAKKLTKGQKAKVRAELRKQVKKNPGAVKRKSFLRRAALVNFKLPVTIRLRNTCDPAQNPTGSATPGGPLLTTENCAAQGTALNQRTIPSATVNLGPSLGSRQVAIGGALAAVVEFQDTYDGGALGNVNLKILPGNKTLTTSSVPLLWNEDITDATTRSDSNFAKASMRSSSALGSAPANDPLNLYGGAFATVGDWANSTSQGCGDWQTPSVPAGQYGLLGAGLGGAGYRALFYGAPYNFAAPAPATYGGAPGYAIYTAGGAPSGGFLPVYAGTDGNGTALRSGGVIGNNNWIGPNPSPFPTGSAPVSSGGSPTLGGLYANGQIYNAANTVLRTQALSLGIASGGVSVNMSTGTPSTPGGLTTAQGSQDVTLGYSGGQANLFGNIPGKSVGIDVTVNLETKINSIVRLMDQDVFKSPSLIEGDDFPAGIFNCRQIVTGAVQNYIPGVRLTGSLRIAPAITKDGKVRIAKATVQSDVNNPDRVALSACLFPAKPSQGYTAGSDDSSAAKIPTKVAIDAQPQKAVLSATQTLLLNGNSAAPVQDTERWNGSTPAGRAPITTPCGDDSQTVGNGPGLADIIRKSGLTGTVSGLPTPTDPAYAGVQYKGDQASVAGDITVNPIDVDVLLGDQSIGS